MKKSELKEIIKECLIEEASYNTQQDYYDARDLKEDLDFFMALIDDMYIWLEGEVVKGNKMGRVYKSFNFAKIVFDQINQPKLRNELQKKMKKEIGIK